VAITFDQAVSHTAAPSRTRARLLAAVWHWHPLAVAAFVFAIDFGTLLALRIFERGAFYLPWGNKTFLFGDSVFLPLYAGFTAVVVHRGVPAGNLYLRRWWHLAVLSAGVGIALLMDLMTVAQGHISIFAQYQLSKTYHTAVFGLLFYLLVSVLPLLLSRRRSWFTAGACLALGCYLSIALIEIQPMAEQSFATAMALAHM
jgi:hypothetical protein